MEKLIINYVIVLPALRCPYEPDAADDERDPFTNETKEFGEKRIIELISNIVSLLYEDALKARLRLI